MLLNVFTAVTISYSDLCDDFYSFIFLILFLNITFLFTQINCTHIYSKSIYRQKRGEIID